MAESVVSFAVETIGNLLIDEAKFLRGVEGKVKDLRRELGLVQGLLRDADARREHNEAVGECVAQLRDFAYDAEDVIERYILKASLKEGQNIIRACACFVAKCTCVQVHKVGTEIEGLKSRISDIGRRMQEYGIQPLNEGERKCARASTPERTYAHFEEEDFVGREDYIKVLVNELLKDGEQQRVISICGMGGLGKTTLAKKVFAHDKVKEHFDGFAWACISQEYRVRDILEGILVKLNPDQREGVTKMKDDELFETLYKTQKEKRCIVVLDDIWTEQAWVGLRNAFPTKDTRSKLLITTRNREVAQHIDPHCFLNEPQCLSQEESWNLLKKKVFPQTKGLVVEISSDGPGVGQDIVAGQAVEDIAKQSEIEGQKPVITEEMKNLAHELLKKCAGLPLAIIVLGGLLAVNDWKMIHEKINLHFSEKSDVSKVLALSYDDLPWHLKPCFLYLGSFPEDAEILVMEVLYMWIAEGFVLLNAYDKEREILVEDVAEQYLTELVNRGMVQVKFNLSGKIKRCHLHDLMRDLCISKALQESFLSILNIEQDNEIENCSASMAIKVESSCKIRRLSLNRNVIPSLKASRRTLVHLRTLMSFGGVKWELKPFQSIFKDYKFLRVLKVEKLRVMRSLPKSMGDLVHLRFLSLAGSRFNGLPQSMGNLVCMEFLDLEVHTTVSMPNVLWKMRRLRYLCLPYKFDIKERFHGGQKKLRFGTLKNLRTLRNFSPKKCDVNDVGKFTNLQKLIVRDQYTDPTELEIFRQLAEFKLKNLRSLSFNFGNLNILWTENELSKMSNYPHSCKLSICGKIEKLPEHRSLPQGLRKLVLVYSFLEEDPMPILEKLPHLVFLMLGCWAFEGKEMVCSAGGFPQLKHLLFAALFNLEEWRAAEGAVPHLSRLGISLCPKLRAVPSHVSTYDGWDKIDNEMRKCCI